MSAEPTFFTLSTYSKSVDDFVIEGIYSKLEDAEAHMMRLPASAMAPSVHPMDRAEIARTLISNHMAYVAPGNRRVTITIEPSESEWGGSRVNIT
jgi:hypothetical protein